MVEEAHFSRETTASAPRHKPRLLKGHQRRRPAASQTLRTPGVIPVERPSKITMRKICTCLHEPIQPIQTKHLTIVVNLADPMFLCLIHFQRGIHNPTACRFLAYPHSSPFKMSEVNTLGFIFFGGWLVPNERFESSGAWQVREASEWTLWDESHKEETGEQRRGESGGVGAPEGGSCEF